MKASGQSSWLFLAIFILLGTEISARPKVFDHNIHESEVYSSHEKTSSCHSPTGDNEYKIERATKLQANLKQPVTWYYALVGGSRPIVFSLFITSPLRLCGRHRLILASIEYYSPYKSSTKPNSSAYKTLSGFSVVDTKDWNPSQLLQLSIVDHLGRKWSIERQEKSTNISVADISFNIDDNNSMHPQGVAPTSFNRASKKGYSTSYVTSFLNARSQGVVQGVAFENAFTYFEHVDTSAFSPMSSPSFEERFIEWACLYISHSKSPFMFQGCADWNGHYNPFTIGTLVDASGKRSGFTNPGFDLQPIKETMFFSDNAQMDFYGSYTIDINFGKTTFSAKTTSQMVQQDFGVKSSNIATYIHPVFFEDKHGNSLFESGITGILEQVRMSPSSLRGLRGGDSKFLISSDIFKQGLKEYLSAFRE